MELYSGTEGDEDPQLLLYGNTVFADCFPGDAGNAVLGFHLDDDTALDEQVQSVKPPHIEPDGRRRVT